MRNSLKKLLGMFPYFLNKEGTSNFYKSQWVTNNQFKDIYLDLFKTYQSFHLDKRLLVWREQSVAYEYTIHFRASFPHLKSVNCYKNDTLIHTESYTYDEDVDTFEYDYTYSTLNDVVDETLAEIIPSDEFKLVVETYEEYTLVKGYPENDIHQGNEFDHDESLDEIGAFHNVPRKEYLIVTSDLYSATEPPYNNCASEDDYHYMKRLIEYMIRYHTTPLPVLELWKLYGIESRMENRERLILKMWDENKHDGLDWIPQSWEHKDEFCKSRQIEGIYFFIQYSTNIPTRTQNVLLNFNIVNSYGKNIADDSYSFDIYIDDILFQRDINSLTYTLNASNFSKTNVSVVRVDCKDNTKEIVGTDEFNVKVRGCDDADFYVSTTGSDTNDGLTKTTPFKTIQKACNSLEADNNLIAILNGNYTITSQVVVLYSCMILGCTNVTIENTTDNRFFKIAHGKELDLQDLKLKYDDYTHLVTDASFINKNYENYTSVITHAIDEYVFVIDSPLIKNLTYEDNVISYETVNVQSLSDLEGIIYDLEYNNDNEITFKEFSLSGETLSAEDIENLRNAITSLTYENYMINYTVLGDEI